jgi:hypothetical protein
LIGRRHKGKGFPVSESESKNMSREERLAARLRENLRRRKAQSRAMRSDSPDKPLPKGEAES